MHSAPMRTTLGLITYESTGPYFTGKKSNLTGLCEILINFDLKISEISEKSQKVMLIMKNLTYLSVTFDFDKLICLACWSRGSVLA